MDKYLSDSIMLEMLAKVQPLQAEILKTGRSAHVDAGVHEPIFGDGASHISFGVTIFEENDIVRDFDFSSSDTQEELEAEYVSLKAYVNRIKSE